MLCVCVCVATRILLGFHDRADESDGHDLAKFYIYIKCLLLYPNVTELGSARQRRFVL